MMAKIKMVQRVVAGLTLLLEFLGKLILNLRGQKQKQRASNPEKLQMIIRSDQLMDSSSSSSSCSDQMEDDERYALRWRLAVEKNNNVTPWKTVPLRCYNHLHNYMTGGQYDLDLNLIVHQILFYASQIPLPTDAFDAWILDVDDTCISNISYYTDKRFGCDPFDSTIFKAWIMKGMCPAIPIVLTLFKTLIDKGFKVFLLTGRDQATLAQITTNNLHNQGFIGYQRLILRNAQYRGQSAVKYKSAIRKEIEEQGYRIWGNVGDQWSDLQGECLGKRTFKLPNPMYFIS